MKQRNLELNPPVCYPGNAAAIAASRNLFEETGAEIGKNMKVNTGIRKMLWLPVEYKDFRSEVLVICKTYWLCGESSQGQRCNVCNWQPLSLIATITTLWHSSIHICPSFPIWLHGGWGKERKEQSWPLQLVPGAAAAAGVCVHLLPADAPAQSTSPIAPCWGLGYIYIIIYQLVLIRPYCFPECPCICPRFVSLQQCYAFKLHEL